MPATQENLIIGSQEGRVLTLSLNRPQALNALNTALLIELSGLLQAADANADIGAVVITGNQKAFAAGADVKEMATMNAIDLHRDPRVQAWADIARFSKPMIAAVNGLDTFQFVDHLRVAVLPVVCVCVRFAVDAVWFFF